MDSFGVAVLQIEQRTGGSKLARVTDVADRLRVAPAAQLIVLPELWDVGWPRFDQHAVEAAPLDTGPLTALGLVARERGCMIAAGSVSERTQRGLHNTAVVVGPEGVQLGWYRKRRLVTPGSAEASVYDPGSAAPTVIDSPLGRIGLAIGWELRFPDHFTALRAAGAELFVVVAHWPTRFADQLRPLAQARAIEHQAAVVVANGWGPADDPGWSMAGGSLVVDAQGRVTAEVGDGPGWLQGEVSVAHTRRLRAEMPMPVPVLVDRAPPPPTGASPFAPPAATGAPAPPARTGDPPPPTGPRYSPAPLSGPAGPPGTTAAPRSSPPGPPAAPSGRPWGR